MSNGDRKEIDFLIVPDEPATVIVSKHVGTSCGQQNEMVVCGHCMWPFLNPGDRLRIEPVDSGAEIKKGWVVAFEWEGRVLTHRVVRVAGEQFWAQGDISSTAQGPIERSKLIGRVVAFERDGSWISIGGEVHRRGGLAYNIAMHQVLSGVQQFAVVKNLWNRVWTGEHALARLGENVATAIAGEVVVAQEMRPEAIYGILQNERFTEQGDLLAMTRRKNRLVLFVAHARRGAHVGYAVLTVVGSRRKVGVVRLSLVNALVMPLGVEQELYAAIDRVAREKGILKIITSVATNNARGREQAGRAGYRQTTPAHSGKEMRKALRSTKEEEVIYEKLL